MAMTHPEHGVLLSAEEVAELAGSHIETVRRAARERRLPGVKVGSAHAWYFAEEAAHHWATRFRENSANDHGGHGSGQVVSFPGHHYISDDEVTRIDPTAHLRIAELEAERSRLADELNARNREIAQLKAALRALLGPEDG